MRGLDSLVCRGQSGVRSSTASGFSAMLHRTVFVGRANAAEKRLRVSHFVGCEEKVVLRLEHHPPTSTRTHTSLLFGVLFKLLNCLNPAKKEKRKKRSEKKSYFLLVDKERALKDEINECTQFGRESCSHRQQ